MVMPKDECAMGIFPRQGNTELDQHNQFTPRITEELDPKNPRALCHGCDQVTMIKTVPPRKGYFVWHKSSVKGRVTGESAKLSGKPARVRGRKQ